MQPSIAWPAASCQQWAPSRGPAGREQPHCHSTCCSSWMLVMPVVSAPLGIEANAAFSWLSLQNQGTAAMPRESCQLNINHPSSNAARLCEISDNNIWPDCQIALMCYCSMRHLFRPDVHLQLQNSQRIVILPSCVDSNCNVGPTRLKVSRQTSKSAEKQTSC